MDKKYLATYSQIFAYYDFDDAVDICIRVAKQYINNQIEERIWRDKYFDMVKYGGLTPFDSSDVGFDKHWSIKTDGNLGLHIRPEDYDIWPYLGSGV